MEQDQAESETLAEAQSLNEESHTASGERVETSSTIPPPEISRHGTRRYDMEEGIRRNDNTQATVLDTRLDQCKIDSGITEACSQSSAAIEITDTEQRSASNRFKGYIEYITEESWEWWPLTPRLRPLHTGESRVKWRCVSFTLGGK